MSPPHRGAGEALRWGDRSAAVTEIRAALAALGHLDADEELTTGKHVAFDVFDQELDHAVRAFQHHRGLLVDGIVGEATYRALKEATYRPGRRPLGDPSVRCPDGRWRRRHAAGQTAGSRLLHRAGRRILRLANPQRVDVLPA